MIPEKVCVQPDRWTWATLHASARLSTSNSHRNRFGYCLGACIRRATLQTSLKAFWASGFWSSTDLTYSTGASEHGCGQNIFSTKPNQQNGGVDDALISSWGGIVDYFFILRPISLLVAFHSHVYGFNANVHLSTFLRSAPSPCLNITCVRITLRGVSCDNPISF